MSKYFVGTEANNQTTFESLTTSEVLDDLQLNTTDSPTFNGLTVSGDVTVNKLKMGNTELYPSGDSNHIHFIGTALIGNSTTASSNPKIGTSTYPFSQVHAGYLYGDGSNLTNLPSGADNTKLPLTGGNLSGALSISSSSGNTLTLKKGTGTPALAFAGTSSEASALMEGIAGGGLRIYTSNGGTLSSPSWSTKMTIAAGGNTTFTGSVTATSLIKSGGTSSQFLKADGSVDSTTYVSSETYSTPSALLTAIKTVDGSGTGLDADKLDGQEGSYYLNYNNFSNTPTVNDVSETNLLNRLAALDSSDTIYIGDAGDDTTVVVRGTLQVDGSTTTINSNTLSIGDNQIVLNNDVTGTPSQNAGIIVERGTSTNASLIWDESSDEWKAGTVGNEIQIALVNGNYSGLRAQATTKADVGLGNVTNESKATMFASPTFTGTVGGVTKAHVGLGNVTNESKATMFSGAALTGNSTATTQLTGDNSTRIATTAYVKGQNYISSVTASDVGLGNVTNESKATMFTSPSFTGDVVITDDTFPFIRSSSNGAGAGIKFSDQSADSYGQYGTLTFLHTNTVSYGSGAAFILGTSETSTTILADGKLMYHEGIYSKPSTGTGAGTRKDTNWDTAYGWGNHASAGYVTTDNNTFRPITAGGNALDSGESLTLTAGSNVTISESGGTVTITAANDNTQLSTAQVRSKISGTGLISYNSSTGVISTTANNYSHHTQSAISVSEDLTGADVLDGIGITVNTEGHVTAASTSSRTLTLGDLGYTGATNANNYSLPEATATVRGGIELFSNTDQSVAANSVSSTSGRTYGIQLNSAGQAVVNVPWSDTNTDTDTNTFRTVTAGGNTLGSGETLALTAGSNVSISEAGGQVTISSTDTNTVYSHPTHNGDDINIDTGALTGATVISDLDFNITTNSLGHVTDANGAVATRTLTAANLGISAPNAPASASAAIVGNTVEVTFAASTTSNIDAYLVYSSIDGSDYGLISIVPPDDFAASMSIIDNAFDETGTQAYRVYAVKYGILSSATTASVSYTVSSAEPTTMSVVNLNNAYYVQWNPPSSNARFVTAYNVYKHEHATQGSLSRGSASLVYSGMNTNYMYQISGTNNNNFHQFWVETTIA